MPRLPLGLLSRPSRLALVALGLGLLPQAADAAINYGVMSMKLQNKRADGTYTYMNATEEREFFTTKSCLCNAKFAVEMTLVGAPAGDLGTQAVEIWVGSSCAEFTTQRDSRCVKVDARQIESFHNKTISVDLDAARLMFPTAGCGSVTGTNTVWALVDQDANQSYDNVWSLSPAINYDTQPPAQPTSPSATGIEEGVRVSWAGPTAGIADVRGYQVLCASAKDRQPVFLQGKEPSGAEYRRTNDVAGCTAIPSTGTPDAGAAPVPPDAGLAPVMPDAGPPDAGGAGAPQARVADTPDAGTGLFDDPVTAYDDLDPRFICSGLIAPTSNGASLDFSDASRMRAGSFDSGVVSKIVIIDQARNYAVTNVASSGPPQPARDAWEYYHDQGGQADGGYCFVATAAYGDYDHPYVKILRHFRDETLAQTGWGRATIAWYYGHSPPWAAFLRAHAVLRIAAALALFPVVALAALWSGLGPVGLLGLALAVVAVRRWRRWRRLVAVAGLAGVLAAAGGGLARAQVILDGEEMRNEPRGPIPSSWAFELKLGPYLPAIDEEAGVTGAPYAAVFGSGSSLLSQVELDRFFLHPAGELGIGASVGYLSNSAKAFKESTTTHMAECTNLPTCRAADETTFRMFPLALLVVYRFTALADGTVVPLVPYGKLGLSYYAWRMAKGNGNLSQVTGGQEASGGTLGWQAAAGLSLRIDRIDRDAARSMESELGVEHVGVFGELTYASVSGLGQEKKLHLGDLTWAAGLNFEF